MSTFRFNFLGKDNSDNTEEQNKEVNWLECEEIKPNKQIEKLDDLVVHAKMFICDDIEIGHVSNLDTKFLSEDSHINILEQSEKENSDLIPGKYEGGLKVWECTSDLIKYLFGNDNTNFNEAKVLDLGCGVGVLGIYALQNGAFVTFQDYNKEVIECVTIPSVLLNIEDDLREDEIKKCKFYSGDWASFNKTIADKECYDIILTSETIYNEKNYDKLINLFLTMLSQNGKAYVAAKTCYFGVGGRIRQFEAHIGRTGLLKSEVVWKSTGGVQREILKVTKNP